LNIVFSYSFFFLQKWFLIHAFRGVRYTFTTSGIINDTKHQIPKSLFHRLKKHIDGPETSLALGEALEKIIDFYEGNRIFASLEIITYPSSINEFKQTLLQFGKAYIKIHNVDGTSKIKEWNVAEHEKSLDVNTALCSGYLQDWQKKGINKVEIAITQNDFKRLNKKEKLPMGIYRIISVEIVSGRSLNNRWNNDMQKIKTDKGIFIDNLQGAQFGFFREATPGYDWSSKIGETVQNVKIFDYKNHLWLNKQ